MSTPKKLPGLAPEIAAVQVSDEGRTRWAWFLPDLVGDGEALLERYDVARPSAREVDEAREVLAVYNGELEEAKRRAAVLVGLAREAGKGAADLEARADVADKRFLDLEANRHRRGATEARAKQSGYEAAARAEIDKVVTRLGEAHRTLAAGRAANNQGKEARLRELQLRYEIAVPRMPDHEAGAAPILTACNSASRKKPGARLTLLLADLARQQLPIPDLVIEALVATLGLSKLHVDKRQSGVTWVDEDTPLRVLGHLAGQQPDQRSAALALFDCVLWYRQHNRVLPGALLNGLAVLFGLVDAETCKVNFKALANATHGSEIDALVAVEAYVDDTMPSPRDTERATGVPRETVRRMHEKGHVEAVQAQRSDQRDGAARVREGLDALHHDAFVVLNAGRAAPANKAERAKLRAKAAKARLRAKAGVRDVTTSETSPVAKRATPSRATGRRGRP